MQIRPILNTTCVLIGAALAVVVAGGAAVALPGSDAPTKTLTRQVVAEAAEGATNRDGGGSDPAQSRNAARSRMRECGHQWSAMKKTGAASGMTWKDFSQGCLAKQ